jgi:hypothetical protein
LERFKKHTHTQNEHSAYQEEHRGRCERPGSPSKHCINIEKNDRKRNNSKGSHLLFEWAGTKFVAALRAVQRKQLLLLTVQVFNAASHPETILHSICFILVLVIKVQQANLQQKRNNEIGYTTNLSNVITCLPMLMRAIEPFTHIMNTTTSI